MPYSAKQIKLINSITSNFYKTIGRSFSSTRQHEWEGWNLCLPYITQLFDQVEHPKILDLGCGNFRFENFLSQNFPDKRFEIDCYDNTKIPSNFKFLDNIKINFQSMDIIEALLDNLDVFEACKYNLIVCFGVFHHIPSEELRWTLFENLKFAMADDSLFICSLWQFEKNPKLMKKAFRITDIAKQQLKIPALDTQDYFLSWQERTDVFRFCHNFTDSEVQKIQENLNLKTVKIFNSDAGTLKLNKYLILK